MPAPSRYTQNAALVARYQQGDTAAAEELLRVNSGLVGRVVRRYLPRCHHLDGDDLGQEGRLGLLRAAASYDPGRGEFSTYATIWIRQAVARAIDMQERSLYVPAHHVAQRGWDQVPVCDLSLDHPTGDEQDNRMGDFLPAGDDPEREAIGNLWQEALLATLPVRERAILEARLAGWSLLEVGQREGMSREGVRTVQVRACEKLRAWIGNATP